MYLRKGFLPPLHRKGLLSDLDFGKKTEFDYLKCIKASFSKRKFGFLTDAPL